MSFTQSWEYRCALFIIMRRKFRSSVCVCQWLMQICSFSPDEQQGAKTQCEHHRDSVQASPLLGAHVPQCDADGQYKPQQVLLRHRCKHKNSFCFSFLTFWECCFLNFIFQCHGSTGQCWCVDSNGQERTGTRTLAGRPAVDCNRPGKARTMRSNKISLKIKKFTCQQLWSSLQSKGRQIAHGLLKNHKLHFGFLRVMN